MSNLSFPLLRACLRVDMCSQSEREALQAQNQLLQQQLAEAQAQVCMYVDDHMTIYLLVTRGEPAAPGLLLALS